MLQYTITIIGAGNIGLSIADGLLRSGFPPKQLTLTKRNLASLSVYAAQGVNVTSDNIEAIHQADVIVIAVKPFKVIEVLQSLNGQLKNDAVVVSVASGVTIADIKAVMPSTLPLFRAMPGIGAAVGESATCIAGDHSSSGMRRVQHVFGAMGATIAIEEPLMEAATVLGACGVAFVLRFMRAMIQGGIQIGFDADTAGKIVAQTVQGAAKLLDERELHPEAAIDMVTTPRGCTIVGLNEMEHSGFSSALIKGLVASYNDILK